MSDEPSSREARVVSLAQSFSERHRKGERPTIDEYVALHPELEAEIREVFPMLCMLEELGPVGPDSKAPGTAPELGPLKRLGEYRIIREIGRGGMGVVYEAEQEALRRRVAIKVLPFQAFQDQHQLDRFRIEAQAAARMHHTNIVPVFGVGEDHGVHYYVMQFIRGQTLAQVLREVRRLRAEQAGGFTEGQVVGDVTAPSVAKSLFQVDADGEVGVETPSTAHPSPENAHQQAKSGEDAGAASNDSSTSISKDTRSVYCRSAARIALQVSEALAYAHNEGILHRDIKPSNLLLDLKGTVWITDFGLAKMQDSAELTATGSLVGTIRYMAPERFKGQGDARSDVYGLGVTLYELLTLRPAFQASERVEVLREVDESHPPHPRRIEPAIPRDLETIVLKAIAREPKDRYPSAAALSADLRRFLNHEPVSARRARAPERLWRWSQRNPALATLSGVSILLLMALAIGSMVSAVHLGAERNRAYDRLIASRLAEGRALRLSREPGSRKRSLDALREAATPATALEVRNEVIGSLALVDLVETARHEEEAVYWSIDPLVERSAKLADDGSIRVYRGVRCEVTIALLPGPNRLFCSLVLSPGGHYLAACRENTAWVVWDVDRNVQLFECEARGEPPTAAFDSTGGRFAHVGKDGSLIIRGLPEGRMLRQFESGLAAEGIAFDASGRRLATAGCGVNSNTVLIHDLDTGALLCRLLHPHLARAVAWHPDGKRVAVACHDFNVYVWDVESGKRLHCLKGHSAEATRVFFGDNGKLLASSGWDNRTLLWDADTGTRLTETDGRLDGFDIRDRRLGFTWLECRGGVGESRVTGGEICRAFHAPVVGKGPRDIAVSPDGRWLAAACYNQGLRVWNLDSPGEPQRVDAGNLKSLFFHPDSSALWVGTTEALYRWPLRQGTGSHEWTLGPPALFVSGSARSLTLTEDGKRAAMQSASGQILIRDLEAGGAVVASLEHPSVSRCKLSPSGRWLVSATFHGADVRVWNVATCAIERSFPVGTAKVEFSRDERWLGVVNGLQLFVYETRTWNEQFRKPREGAGDLGGPVTFSPDGNYVAYARSRTLFSLLRVEDGSEIARFEMPDGSLELFALTFSPDQSLLLAAVTNSVRVWDLRLIRRELSKLGLDWDSGASLPEPPRSEPRVLQIFSGGLPPLVLNEDEQRGEVGKLLDLHTQRILADPAAEAFAARAALLEAQQDWPAALADLDRALEASPLDVRTLLRRAAVLMHMGKAKEAMKDSDRAVALCCGPSPASSPLDAHRTTCPIFREALRDCARIHTSLGEEQLESAFHDWKMLLSLDPEDREARESLPWLWVVQRCSEYTSVEPGNSEDGVLALECAEKNYREASENDLFARDLGSVKYHLGRLEEALPLLEKAWRLNTALYPAAFHLAMIQHRLGQQEKARDLFETALAESRKRMASRSNLLLGFERMRSFTERMLSMPASPGARS